MFLNAQDILDRFNKATNGEKMFYSFIFIFFDTFTIGIGCFLLGLTMSSSVEDIFKDIFS